MSPLVIAVAIAIKIVFNQPTVCPVTHLRGECQEPSRAGTGWGTKCHR